MANGGRSTELASDRSGRASLHSGRRTPSGDAPTGQCPLESRDEDALEWICSAVQADGAARTFQRAGERLRRELAVLIAVEGLDAPQPPHGLLDAVDLEAGLVCGPIGA